jgi:hypothetical protein
MIIKVLILVIMMIKWRKFIIKDQQEEEMVIVKVNVKVKVEMELLMLDLDNLLTNYCYQ